jgi:spore maturation protein CgeB
MAAYDLTGFDGVLAFGAVLRDLYLARGAARRAWVWHEAADAHVFAPVPVEGAQHDVAWIGNWGDEERTTELRQFLLEPVTALGLAGRVHGVRYPVEAQRELERCGLSYGGWLPNPHVPRVLAQARVAVHVPRRPYTRVLPGIPTIRVFEALACGAPLLCAPWEDREGLFTPGADYWIAADGEDMQRRLRLLLHEPEVRHGLAEHGRRTVLERHTCAHRVAELLTIAAEIAAERPRRSA